MIYLLYFFSLIEYLRPERITTYFLNSDFDYRAPQYPADPNIECLHSSEELEFPSNVTFCYRAQGMMFLNHQNPWISVAGYGTINSDFLSIEEGVIFGIWETGPWMAMKYKTSDSYSWIGLGKDTLPNLQVWRHTCLSIDFTTGHVKRVENGLVRFKTQSNQIRQLGDTMNIVAAGCYYRPNGLTKYQSMYGRVTDVQMFSRILSDEEMEDISGCKRRGVGDILDWDSASWIKRGPKQTIRRENLDFEKFVCKFPEKSYHLVPQPWNFVPESLDVCKKFSARLAGHENEAEFGMITQYLSQENIVKTEQCLTDVDQEDSSVEISTWLAIDDNDQELVWTHWYSGRPVTPLPWAENRPYNDGKLYNCVRLRMVVKQTPDSFGELKSALLNDDQCYIVFCPICSIEEPVLKIFVRGLCKKSLFNRVYMYNIDHAGDILYLGEKSSSISYDPSSHMWVWYDSKDNRSTATSASSYDSLLIGVHTFDFGGVVQDKCKKDGVIRRLKFTTCSDGQFTCDDGLCVGIEQRCDQIPHCNDNSDEKNCNIIDLESRYRKNIAPFIIKNSTNR